MAIRMEILGAMLGHDGQQVLDELGAVVIALIAYVGIFIVGRQDRRPGDMWARQIGLAVVGGVAACHAMTPAWLPEIVQQYAVAALLVIFLTGGRRGSNPATADRGSARP